MPRPSVSDHPSTSSRVRGLLADVLELAQVRFEVHTIEARQEVLRLGQMAVFGAFAVTFLSFGLIFLAIFLTVLFWDSHRLVALGIFTALFLGGGIAFSVVAWARFKEGSSMFSATRDELQRDQERLRS